MSGRPRFLRVFFIVRNWSRKSRPQFLLSETVGVIGNAWILRSRPGRKQRQSFSHVTDEISIMLLRAVVASLAKPVGHHELTVTTGDPEEALW